MASVYYCVKRKYWIVSWRESKKNKVKYFHTKAEAEGFNPSSRPVAISAVSNFDTIIENFKNTLNVRESTLRRYQQEIQSLRQCMLSGDTSRENILRTIAEIQKQFSSAKAVRIIKRLRTLCKFGEIAFPPGVHARHKGKKGRAMDEKEVHQLLKTTQLNYPRYYLLLCILLDTGARLGEILALNWSDWDGESVHITKSYNPDNKGPKIVPVKTCRSNRVVPLSAPLNALLNDFKGLPGHPMCASKNGCRMHKGNLRRDWWCKVSNGYRIHDLRHTCATFLLNHVDPRIVSARLGHEDTTTTLKIYDHLMHNKKNLPSLLQKCST